jgi:MoaA/NifB/PqqE/SkfB family radical SAM enzyme
MTAKSKTFCILPFVHSTITTNGDIQLCCVSQEKSQHNINESNVANWWNSSYLKEVRQKMLDGQEIDACRECYDVEKKNLISHRQKFNKEYKIVQTKHADKIIDYLGYTDLLAPIYMEVQLTNLCNLKCIMCREQDSSAFLTENKKLNIAVHNQQEFEWNTHAIEQIRDLFNQPNINFINLRGGEPFMVPQIKEILLSSIANGTAKNIKLHISTNCTKFDESWVEVLSNFKEIRMMCSIDATDRLLEYIRFGSNWQLIQDNISLMRKITNVNIIVNAVLQNTNLLGIDKLINWCQDEKLFLQFESIMHPMYLKTDVLPNELHKLAKERLLTAQQNLKDSKLILNLPSIIESMECESQYLKKPWQEFIKNIAMRESIRGNSLVAVVPELAEYINA